METQTTTSTTPVAPPRKPTKKATAPRGEKLPLKKVCSSLKIDPKTARRILRKQKLGFHDLGNRWELTPSQASKVKEVLRDYLTD
jgi:hypothetical protein